MQLTILSSKGQLVIPKTIRQAHGWHSGDKFIVIEQENGIFLKPATPYSQLTIDDVIGCTGYRRQEKISQRHECRHCQRRKKAWLV